MVNAAQAEYSAQRFFLLFFQVVSLDMYAFLQQWDMAVIMLQIVAIDLLLGGDNAVVIAMACRKLPPQKRTKAIIIGTVGAILARVLLLAIALYLLSLPWLKIVGALLLLWIGIKLVRNEEEESEVSSSGSLWRTAITITVADVIMSLDNVLAVAAAGKGHIALVALGVAISIPVIVAGSKLVLVLLTRFPAVVLLGGMLIGWIAGSMLVSDPTIRQLFPSAGEGTRAWLAPSARCWCYSPDGAAATAAGERLILSTAPSTPTASSFRHFSSRQGAFALRFILTPVPGNM
ncbi:membrane protein [Klebsiella pneumoniae subsp. ozaenae]|uniref:Membrane protein n=1 Tax=Klebsiella pneumoniae subsp. ozaenae TaxID=574 RepID=A0A378B4P8_KLEPO|nr:membrane protein [Klebsiella pneumoniae subsp. ozaenae]